MRGQHTESRGMSRTLPAKKGGRGSGSRRLSGVAGICADGRTDGRTSVRLGGVRVCDGAAVGHEFERT